MKFVFSKYTSVMMIIPSCKRKNGERERERRYMRYTAISLWKFSRISDAKSAECIYYYFKTFTCDHVDGMATIYTCNIIIVIIII